jgi:hypothetical protein
MKQRLLLGLANQSLFAEVAGFVARWFYSTREVGGRKDAA